MCNDMGVEFDKGGKREMCGVAHIALSEFQVDIWREGRPIDEAL